MEPTPETPALPGSVTRVDLGGREVYLVATAHVSRKSVEDVRATIDAVRPEAVCVELCDGRYRNLVDREAWRKTDLVKVIRGGRTMLLLASLIMASFQRRIAQRLGVTPGAEMVEAIERARATGARLVLADRDVQVTLKRTWGRLRFRDKMRMLGELGASLFALDQIDEAAVEELKKEQALSGMLEMLAREFPRVKDTLVDERDVYLAQKIRGASGDRVVAVVGAAHVPGIVREIGREASLAPLEEVPGPPLWPRLVQWSIPPAILGLLAYGFLKGGPAHLLGSIGIWVLLTGGLSALGALLALGHPLTIAAAFLAAPITTLHPLIAAGWVAGLVQAVVRRPTVGDLESLPDAVTSVRGFWMNPATRVLLVVVLSNLGSMLGVFLSGGWIAGRAVS
jgi:pheromone shutdown-related protein TraB